MKIARTDAGLASALRVSVMRLSRRLRNERDASDDLTANQLAVLGTLWRNGAMTIGDLAAAEKVQPPSMTRTVNVLCRQGPRRPRPRAPDRQARRRRRRSPTPATTVIEESRRRKEAWLNHRLERADSRRAADPAGRRSDPRAPLARMSPTFQALEVRNYRLYCDGRRWSATPAPGCSGSPRTGWCSSSTHSGTRARHHDRPAVPAVPAGDAVRAGWSPTATPSAGCSPSPRRRSRSRPACSACSR